MSPDTIATLAAAAVIVGLLWSLDHDAVGLHRDTPGPRERMARLEGAVHMLIKFLRERARVSSASPNTHAPARPSCTGEMMIVPSSCLEAAGLLLLADGNDQ